jgi:hypothetical protein
VSQSSTLSEEHSPSETSKHSHFDSSHSLHYPLTNNQNNNNRNDNFNVVTNQQKENEGMSEIPMLLFTKREDLLFSHENPQFSTLNK